MNSNSRPRSRMVTRIVACIALLGAVMVLFQPGEGHAGPYYQKTWKFFTDEYYNQQVGYRKNFCNGGSTSWGTTSGYYLLTYDPCVPDNVSLCYECTPQNCIEWEC